MEIKLYTEYIKLSALLKYAGVCISGGEADVHIREGAVLLNGEPCTVRGKKVVPGDRVVFNNTEILVK